MPTSASPRDRSLSRALLLTALLLAASLATLAPAGAHDTAPWPTGGQATVGTVMFMNLDETKLVNPDDPEEPGTVFGIAPVMVNVTDTKLVEDSIVIRITSESDQTGEEITLHRVERAGDKAAYHGFVGFERTRVADNGQVFVKAGDKVTAIYVDDAENGGTRIRQADVTWQEGDDGQILLDAATYRGFGEAQVEVRDKAVDGTQQIFMVRVTSDADPVGFSMGLEKTTSGVFKGTFSFGPSDPLPDPPIIGVQDGDTVRVEYAADGKDRRGHPERPHAEVLWRDAHTGRVQFTDADYRTVLSDSPVPVPPLTMYGTATGDTAANAGAWIRVEDRDRAGAGQVTVNVRSTHGTSTNIDPTGISRVLKETGAATGEFLGHVGFITGQASTTDRLRVTHGATVDVRYTDATNAAGDTQVHTASGTWQRTHDATLEFRAAATGTAKAATYNATYENATLGDQCQCHPNLGHLHLTDLDLAGDETATVRLTSDRDPLGVDVTLDASPPGSGVFRGTFGFNATRSFAEGDGPTENEGRAAIWALHGDKLQAVYLDERDEQGQVARVQAAAASGTQVSITTVPTDQNKAPTPVTGLQLVISGTAGGTTPATNIDGRVRGTTTLHVRLADSHRNTDSNAAETVTVRVGSTISPVNWASGGGFTGGVAVTLTETGANTGVFQGSRQLGGDTGLAVADGNRVCAYHLHNNQTGVPVQVRASSCATWNHMEPFVNAEVEFRDARHQGELATVFAGLGEAWVFVRDGDPAASTTRQADKVKVRVTSESDQTGIEIELTERYGWTGMAQCSVAWGGCAGTTEDDRGFHGSFGFTKGPSVAGEKLRVAHDDTVSAFYVDPRDESGSERTMVVHTMWLETTDATLSIDRALYRHSLDDSTFVQVTVRDPDQSFSASSANSVDVTVRNDRLPDAPITVTLTETTATSGVFRGEFGFHRENDDGTPDDDELEVADEDTFTVMYVDPVDRLGRTAVEHEAGGMWIDVVSAHLTLDAEFYATYGAIATITLDDPSSDATSLRDEVWVTAISDSDGSGERVLLRETGANTGVFRGGFSFEEQRTAGNARLVVKDGDLVSVHFIDKEQDGDGRFDAHAAKRADAVWEITEHEPPELSVTTAPPAQDGVVQIDVGDEVSFTLQATSGRSTIASWSLEFGDGTTPLSGMGPPPSAPVVHLYNESGTFDVVFSATDVRGAEASTGLSVATRVDDSDIDPPGPITDLEAEDVRLTRLDLVWTVPENDAAAPDGRAPEGYQVRFVLGGDIATDTDWSNATPVSAGSLTWDPALADASAGDVQRVRVGGLTADTEYTFAVRALDTGANRGAFDSVIVTTADVDEWPPEGVPEVSSPTHAEGVATTARDIELDWLAVEEDESPESLRYHFRLGTDATHTITCTDEGTTDLFAVFEDQAPGTYHFHLAAGSDGGCADTVSYGPIIIEAGGPALSDAQILAVNQGVILDITRQGTSNVISWTLPSNLPLEPEGVQVWYSSSPFQHLATLGRGSLAFQESRYVHEDAPADAMYLVTVYYQDGLGLASDQDPGSVPGFDSLTGTAALQDGRGFIEANWMWLAVALGALLLILVVVLVVVLRPKRSEDDVAEPLPEADPWAGQGEDTWDETEAYAEAPDGGYEDVGLPEGHDAPAYDEGPAYEETDPESYYDPGEGAAVPGEEGEEGDVGHEEPADPNLHHLTCPGCGAAFVAHGPRPLVTECPSCGVRGILR